AELKAPSLKGKFKMPKFDKPKFGVSASMVEGLEGQVSLPTAQVDLPSASVMATGEVPSTKVEGAEGKLEQPSLKMPKEDIKSPKVDINLPSVDVTLPKESFNLQAPEAALTLEGEAKSQEKEAAKAKDSKFKMPKFDIPKFGLSTPKVEGVEGQVSLPTAQVDLPSASVRATGEVPSAKIEGVEGKVEKPSLKMPKVDIKAPKVDINLPSVDVTLPKASLDLQAPEAALTLEGEGKAPEKEASKTKDSKFKMPKFGMPSFGWSSSREAKGTVDANVDVSLKEPQVMVPLASMEDDVTLPVAEIEAPVLDCSADSSSGKEGEIGKSKSSIFRMPKFSLSKSSKQIPCNSEVDISVSESSCYSVTEGSPAVLSVSVRSKHLPEITGESSSGHTNFRFPSLGFSKVDIGSSKILEDSPLPKGDVTLTKYQINLADTESKISPLSDETISITDVGVLKEDGSLQQGGLKAEEEIPAAETCGGDTEFVVKIPKFRAPKFGVSWSKGKPSESDTGSKVESETSQGRITSDVTYTDIEKPTQIPDADLGVKMHKSSPDIVLYTPKLDVSLPTTEATMPKLEVEICSPDLEKKAEQEVVSGEKDAEEKENKFRTPKFKLPSFSWSPKKEAIVASEVEGHMEGPTLPSLSGDAESELTFPTPENQYIQVEFDASAEKDGEKGKTKRSQFMMPKISFPKMKGQKLPVSLPILETEVCGPKQEKDYVSVQKSKQESSGEEAGMGMKMPEVTVPTLEFSKPEVKAPKVEMDISMHTGEVRLPTYEEDDLTLKSAAANASFSTSDIKMINEGSLEVKSPDTSVERTSSEIGVGDVEIKIEGPEGKTKPSKFQMPKFGITHSKGKGSEKDIPDVEKSHPERTAEGTQISIKLADVKISSQEFFKIETGASQTEISSAKSDAALAHPEGSFQQAAEKSSSADGDTSQKTDIEFSKGEPLLELRSPEIVTEKSTVVDGRKIKLEGPEGKIKMPKFQKPKFGISLTKGRGPETEVSSPKIEAELPQEKMTKEIDDIAVGVPAPELASHTISKSGDSVKSTDVRLPKLEGHISLSAEKADSRVNIEKTETYADIVKRGAEGQKMHTSDFTVSSAELSKSYLSASETDKDNSLTNRFPATTVETVEKSQDGPEVYIKIPKLKIPRFTFQALPIEADVSLSTVVTDQKGSSTDIEV
ncbi:AHNK protein, partial [Ceuthmochares aereus]|nr:AHNK protein [Ceuthmochares aereus]